MSDHIWKAYAHGMNVMLQEGGLHVSSLLLKSYRSLGLSDSEAMLLLQMLQFSSVERNPFPTPEELAERMEVPSRQVTQWLQKLINNGFITIDQETIDDVIVECYNFTGWYIQASNWYAQQLRENKKADRQRIEKVQRNADTAELFQVFEQEFGRPISPMEYETIIGWIDQDRYSDEIIRFALKEAVFSGKLSFRYIDRILIEWARNRVTTPEEAKLHSQKFYSRNI